MLITSYLTFDCNLSESSPRTTLQNRNAPDKEASYAIVHRIAGEEVDEKDF